MLIFFSQDLEHIEQIWTLNKEWEGLWSEWKVSKFSDIKSIFSSIFKAELIGLFFMVESSHFHGKQYCH